MSNTTKKDYALTLVPEMVNSLACKALIKETKNILKIEARTERDKWLKAESLFKIYDGELYKEDYGNFTNYVKAIQTLGNESKSTYSKMVNAYKFISSENAKKYGFTTENMIYATAYLLSTIKDFDKFMEFTGGADLTKLSYSKLEELKKNFESDDIIDITPNSSKEVTESEEENADVEIKEKASGNEITGTVEKGLFTFTYKNKTYVVPIKELKQYIQK